MDTCQSTPIHSFLFSLHYTHVYKYTHITLNSRHNCTPAMNAIKILFICMCLYTILNEIEADTKDDATTPKSVASKKISKPSGKLQKPGRRLGQGRKTSSTNGSVVATKVEKPQADQGGIILDLIASLL
ncbi:unnamed protein product [Schistosoma intercalatum]|nr:unnamed protein product [Schistosoma intercalatum]CAH8540043.1 unnamed protein product [Schistosoma intercalatum]